MRANDGEVAATTPRARRHFPTYGGVPLVFCAVTLLFSFEPAAVRYVDRTCLFLLPGFLGVGGEGRRWKDYFGKTIFFAASCSPSRYY